MDSQCGRQHTTENNGAAGRKTRHKPLLTALWRHDSVLKCSDSGADLRMVAAFA
jgi:hypothetical protein